MPWFSLRLCIAARVRCRRMFIFIPIPRGVTFRAKARGVVPKHVRCEQCGYEYVYLLESVITAQSQSFGADLADAERKAERQADAGVRRELQQIHGVIPCSECGHVQDNMVPYARQEHHAWMRTVAYFSFAVGFVMLLPYAIYRSLTADRFDGIEVTVLPWGGFATAIVIGIASLAARYRMAQLHDPNGADVEIRKKAGRDGSVSSEEYEKCRPRSHRIESEIDRRIHERMFPDRSR
jgi:hypothetical protein